MTERVLVAGIGNVFFRDDGFGVELAWRLAPWKEGGVAVVDYGIRELHLAYDLLEPWDLLVILDATPRGGPPGTLYAIEPNVDAARPSDAVGAAAHGNDLASVFTAARGLGADIPRALVIGCEPADVGAGIGLSPVVDKVMPSAVELVHSVVDFNAAAPSGRKGRRGFCPRDPARGIETG